MTGREWKPGDVVTLDASDHWNSLRDGMAARRVAAFLREIEAMWGHRGDLHLTANNGGTGTLRWLAEAFESVSHDPKPEEPTGLGAVVEDANGKIYVLAGDGWLPATVMGMFRNPIDWDNIDVVRVLSEGVQS